MAESSIQIKEAEDVQQLGSNIRTELEELRSVFEKKGSVGLWWDSKVSENDKRFYYFISTKSSNKEQVVQEIEKFSEICGKLETVSEYSLDEVEKLGEEVKELVQFAREELKATESTCIYRACKSILGHGIDEKVEKAKNAVGTYEFKKLRGNLGQIVKVEAEKLNKEYREENTELKNEYQTLLKQKEELRESHDAALRQLKEENEKLHEELEKTAQDSKTRMIEIEERLDEERLNRVEMEKRLKEENEKRAEEIEKKLRRQSQLRATEREESLLNEMLAMAEQMKELMKETEKLKLAKPNKYQSCPNLHPTNSPLNSSLQTINEQGTVTSDEQSCFENGEKYVNDKTAA